MQPRTVRRLVLVVFVGGIAGMIAGSIADNNGVAITFGLVTAVGALGLILVTSVAGPSGFASPPAELGDELALEVEERIGELVDAGADEQQVRRLVQRAVALGRFSRSST